MSILIFIDSNIPDYQVFADSVKVPIGNFGLNTFDPNTNRIGFVWKNNKRQMPFGSIPYEYEQTSEMLPDPIKNTTHYFTKEFVDYLVQFTDPITVDLITCSLDSPVFISDLEQIKTKLPNVTFNYSVNLTGNAPEGDWIMESSGEDIKSIYFNDNIDNWTHVLALPSSNILDPNFTFSNTDPNVLRYTLNTAFTISTSNQWNPIDISHTDAATKVIVDGAGFKITVTADYFQGMFIAGNSANDTYATELINFNFESTATNITTLLAQTNGYLKITNCKAIVNSNISNGGVFTWSVYSVNKITLTNSYVVLTGNITNGGGSLIGGLISVGSGNVEINCCYSIVNGDIMYSSGGLVGIFVGMGTGKTLTISNTYIIFNGNLINYSSVFLGLDSGAFDGNLIFNNNLIIANIINTDLSCNFVRESLYSQQVSSGSKNYILDLTGNRTNSISDNQAITNVWSKLITYNDFFQLVNANLRHQTDKFTSTDYKITYDGTEYTFPSLELLDTYDIVITNTPANFSYTLALQPAPGPVQSGGDPIIQPVFGPQFALASHIKYVNLLADYKNKIFINAQVDMLDISDWPEQIYWDSGFTPIDKVTHIYANSYYRKFFIKFHEESIEIDADTLIVTNISNQTKIKIAKFKPITGLKSISFDKTYPLLNSTIGLKVGFGNYLLTLTADINTDDRHHLELLDVRNADLSKCSGALISKDKIIRISSLDGVELGQFESDPLDCN